MKTIQTLILLAVLVTNLTALSAQLPAGAAAEDSQTSSTATNTTNAGPRPTETVAHDAPVEASAFSQTAASDTGAKGLSFNYRGASLDLLLNYLSEAAGFIIVLEAQPRGKVDAWSSQPLTKDEALNLLDSVLKKNGLAAIRNDRTLTIVNRDEAGTRDIPVRVGGEPENIPRTDEIVTQIIPVRFVEVAQLIKNLQSLVSPKTSMTANESGNSLIVTDTQANIRKVAEIIKAIDSSAEDVTVVRVFHLQYADPAETAELLSSLFAGDSNAGRSQSPMQFGLGETGRFGGGPGGGPGGSGSPGSGRFGLGGPGGGTTGTSGNQNLRIQKRSRIVAVADPRTSSVVITAARDLMSQIESVVTELDSSPAMKEAVHVVRLQNIDPQSALQVLQDMFAKSGTTSSRSSSSQSDPLQSRITRQSQQTTSGTTMGAGGSGGGRSSTFGQ